MMPEVQCRACRLLEESGEQYYCPEKGRELDGLFVSNIRHCKHYQPAEEFGSEMHEDHVMGFMAPVGAVAMSKEKREKARDGIMVKMEEKRQGRPPKVTQNDVDVMVAQYNAGASLSELAGQVGVNKSVIYDHLKKAGVKLRGPGGKKTGKSPAKAKSKKPRVSKKMQDVSPMTQPESPATIIGPGAAIGMEQPEEAPKVIVTDDGEPELPRHLLVTAESLVKSIDEHNAKQPRFHCAEDNLEEFLRDYFGNLAPRRLYQLPEYIREHVDKLTRALFEGRAA